MGEKTTMNETEIEETDKRQTRNLVSAVIETAMNKRTSISCNEETLNEFFKLKNKLQIEKERRFSNDDVIILLISKFKKSCKHL